LDGSRRSLPRVVIPVLLVVAIIGYLVGIHRSSTSSAPAVGGAQHVASGTSVLLEYPSSWQSATTPPTLPGLKIVGPLLLAPAGKSAQAGLLSGQFPAGAPSPLPASFVALVHGVPHVEVVSLAHLQAYRFSRLSGYQRTLDVYVIPTVGGSPTALICYAPNGSSSYLAQCERIVASVTLVGQASYNLSPSATYAGQLGALVSSLDKGRLTLRRQIRASTTASALSNLATTLADRFASAATSLTALEPPQAASAAQAALATALTEAHSAYTALATAAAAEASAGYSTAETQVSKAESAVNTALENFALLGYNHT
jgi:hypothetical protein